MGYHFYAVVLQAVGNARHYFFFMLISKSAAGCKACSGDKKADGFLQSYPTAVKGAGPKKRLRLSKGL